MSNRFVVWVTLDTTGSIKCINLLDNIEIECTELQGQVLPAYMHERIALLKLVDGTDGKRVGAIGRRIRDSLLIYLSDNEYRELRECEYTRG